MVGDAGDIAVGIVAVGYRGVVGIRHLQDLIQIVIAVGRRLIVAIGQAAHATHAIVGQFLRIQGRREGHLGEIAFAIVAKAGRVAFAILFAGNRSIPIVGVGSRGNPRATCGRVLC